MNPFSEVFATERFTWQSPLSPSELRHALTDLGLGRQKRRRGDKPLVGSLGPDRFVAKKRVTIGISGVVPQMRAQFEADDAGSTLQCRLGPPVVSVATRVLFPPLLIAIVTLDTTPQFIPIGAGGYAVLMLSYLLGARTHRRFVRDTLTDELRIGEARRAVAG